MPKITQTLLLGLAVFASPPFGRNGKAMEGHALDPPNRSCLGRFALGLRDLAVVGFSRIASAIEARDGAALAKLVDFRALRKSLTKQIVAAYIELTGKEKQLGLMGKTLAVGIGTSYAEPIVAELLNEQTLIDLLTKGQVGGGGGVGAVKVPAELAPFSKSAMQSAWQTWWASEYGLGDYYIYLPPDKAPDKQFKVRLSLKDLQWKLTGLDLPGPMRVELAQQLVKQRAEKSE
jgi:hypothetical protein